MSEPISFVFQNIYTFNPSSSAYGRTYRSPTDETEALLSSRDFAAYIIIRKFLGLKG
jgi:hypothetical protein